MKSFGNHPLPYLCSSSKSRGKQTNREKRATAYCWEECLWGPIKECFRGLLVMRASFSPVSLPPMGALCVFFPLTCSPRVTPGSKSKLNLILIHLIEEPDPKVRAVFDLLQGMGRKDYGWLSYLGAWEKWGLLPPFLLVSFSFLNLWVFHQTTEDKERGVSTIQLT